MSTQSIEQQPDSSATQAEANSDAWQGRAYFMGAFIGAGLGLAAAYFFTRAASENDSGKPEPISTATVIGLILSIISILRQIAESGKQKKPKK